MNIQDYMGAIEERALGKIDTGLKETSLYG